VNVSESDASVRSALRGYRAAAKVIDSLLDEAQKKRPKQTSYKMQRLAAYREGYFDGLLMAHCQHAMGENPEQNQEAIDRAMQNAEVSHER